MTPSARSLLFPVSVAALLAIGGCSEPPATPPVTLAGLERPVLTLKAAPDARRPSRLSIPAGALVERGGLPGVFVMREGRARFRMVRIGKRAAGQLEVLSGLAGDETLVLGNLADVHDGSPVAVK